MTLKRVGNARESLHDLDSGHVGVELVKPGATPPVASDTGYDIVISKRMVCYVGKQDAKGYTRARLVKKNNKKYRFGVCVARFERV